MEAILYWPSFLVVWVDITSCLYGDLPAHICFLNANIYMITSIKNMKCNWMALFNIQCPPTHQKYMHLSSRNLSGICSEPMFNYFTHNSNKLRDQISKTKQQWWRRRGVARSNHSDYTAERNGRKQQPGSNRTDFYFRVTDMRSHKPCAPSLLNIDAKAWVALWTSV